VKVVVPSVECLLPDKHASLVHLLFQEPFGPKKVHSFGRMVLGHEHDNALGLTRDCLVT
jgi:hypothetical protein